MYHSYPNFGPTYPDPNFTYAGPCINENIYDLSIPAETNMEQKLDDELFVESWLSKRGKLISPPKTAHKKATKPVKINNIKNSLTKCSVLIKKLEETRKFMSDNINLPPEDWKNKFFEASALRLELQSCLVYLQTPENFTAAKSALAKRQRKRLNEKRQRLERKDIKAVKKEERQRAHQEIDQWLNAMKNKVEREKEEEEMKKEADLVLGEVTKKKSDARKQLTLINALVKLKNVRDAVASQRGEKISLEDQLAFNKTTDRLISMWENALKVYSKEEQGLKIMLEQTAEENMKTKGSKDRIIYQQWERVLFGQNTSSDSMCWMLSAADREFDAFIDIRKRWDSFLSKEEGSNIPIGWVTPGMSPGTGWDQYLQNSL